MLHLRHLNPFAPNLGELLRGFTKILIPELNGGQLLMLIRSRFLVDARGLNKVQGQGFQVDELVQAIDLILDDRWGDRLSITPRPGAATDWVAPCADDARPAQREQGSPKS